MKTCVIVHCWEGYPNYCWYPWLKNELQEIVKTPNSETYLVGHSLGCITILRYLENLQEKQQIGGVVMVAGFIDNLGYEELSSFFEKPIDFNKIEKHCKKFVAIHSDNDPYVSLKNGDVFKDKLSAKVITKNQMGHFSGEIENEESCTELPDVVGSILEISK